MNLQAITVTEVVSAFSVRQQRGNQTDIINRKSYGLTFALSGKIVYTINGTQVVSDRNHALFLPKGKSYHLRCTDGGDFPVINFDICGGPDINTIQSVDVRALEYYLKSFDKIERLLLFNMRSSSLHVMSQFYEILARLNDEQLQSELSGRRISLDSAVRYLEQHYNVPGLCIESLARQANISEVYFRKRFREQYGMSPKQYIQQIRMEKAEELLESNLFSVTAIAEKTGFHSVYHFCRAFKQYTGRTPMEYKKQSSASDNPDSFD